MHDEYAGSATAGAIGKLAGNASRRVARLGEESIGIRDLAPNVHVSIFTFYIYYIAASDSLISKAKMSSPALPTTATTPTGSRPMLDPLAFDNVRGLAGTQSAIDARSRGGYDAEEAEEDNGEGTARRARRGPAGVDVSSIPQVKDTTGETVMESFAIFLEKSVYPPLTQTLTSKTVS